MISICNKIPYLLLCLFLVGGCTSPDSIRSNTLKKGFISPLDSARPGVYWYFTDGNLSKEGMTKDLEAMKDAGIGYVVFLEVNVGVPRGKVDFLSEEWQDLFGHAVKECERLGIFITLGVGPGWTGSGGPWVEAAQSMQHLVYSTVEVSGAGKQNVRLPKPAPRRPFFGEGSFTPEVKKQWEDFYEDVAVLAFLSGATQIDTLPVSGSGYFEIPEIDERALYYRKPYSSAVGVPQYIPLFEYFAENTGDVAVDKNRIIDLTDQMRDDGSLEWDVPPGRWTVMRFGSRNNGAVTRPAPLPGVGLEADKFDTTAMNAHLDKFTGQLFGHIGFRKANPAGGLQMLHMDSWEMGAQNWTGRFREEFMRRRGYDPLPFYPVYAGVIVQSREVSERFLWDLRQTSQELVLEYHAGHIKRYGQRYGLGLSIEPYDMNPTADLELAAVGDMPMCEFWSIGMGCNTSFSTGEGASVAHLTGQPVVPAESFTAHLDGWRQHPASVKDQGEWAFAAGINRLVYHTYQHQALPDSLRPGMTFGPYGVHWDRNQTWWPMSDAYHRYVARCQYMLQQGRTVADILYLSPESAPHVFRAPASAFDYEHEFLPDRKGYNFDGCPPSLLYQAAVKDGRIVFPGGATYRLLALPAFKTMTPALLKKISDLVREGATVVGCPPEKSPSLSGYPGCDSELRKLAQELWGSAEAPENLTVRAFGQGKIVWSKRLLSEADNLYPPYEVTASLLSESVPPDFQSEGSIRYTHRTLEDMDIYFVSNRTEHAVSELCKFRSSGKKPELWNPVTGETRALPEYEITGELTLVRLNFDLHEGYFIVFHDHPAKPDGKTNFPQPELLTVLSAPWTVSFDPKWGGPASVVFEQLTDWSQHADTGIKYYSGTAVYRQTFDLPDRKDKTLLLDLGKVKNMARVRLNGKDLGVVWTAPWQVNITDAAMEKGNQLEIEVVNLWANRLIGDEQLPDDGIRNGQWPEWLTEGKARTGGRYTFATFNHYHKDSPLQESGLIGPVKVLGIEN
ncbi:MAG: glycosyl hydrolase [Tannerella sp.]|jgi:hypothetical protein|nr:glycosyl hydrolase [Tannerella sp.]